MYLSRQRIITKAVHLYVQPQIQNVRPYYNAKSSQRFRMLKSPVIATLSYGDFLSAVDDNKIEKVLITEDEHNIQFESKDGFSDAVNVPDTTSPEFFKKLVEKKVLLEFQPNNLRKLTYYAGLFMQLLFFFMIGSLALQYFTGSQKGGGGQFSFGKSNAKLIDIKEVNVKFADVAGLDEAKMELQEVIDFLKQPEKYSIVGGKIPKGCLLVGPPGTGKTLLAKAVAGEAGVPFFSCSASEFIELFIGIGASRVRDMFKKAAAAAPCIIFIDEIDAIGKARGSQGMLGGNDEREQTINQLLTEMDGFKDNNGVIVIAATNRVDVLDQALLRPGRFDRQIQVDLPNLQGRIAILDVHTRNKPLDDSVSLASIAKITTGFSGADLANLANEAAILAARLNQKKIYLVNFEKALERVLLGLEQKPITSMNKRRLVAYHEAGHTILAMKVGSFDAVRKVTILPRGKTGGVTMFEPDQERLESGLYSKQYLENQIVVALGGRIAEEIVFGKDQATTGAVSDLEKVQQVARMMVSMYGFTEEVGPIAWRMTSRLETQYSESMLACIDQEIQSLVNRCYDRAYDLMLTNRTNLDVIAEKLLEVETLSKEDLDCIVI